MLRALAPAKVNLCLFLGARRGDGRHELVTLLESTSLADELTLRPIPGGGQDEVCCPGVKEPNLVSVALRQLRLRGWEAPPVAIEVRKRVPIAAGLGGGSGDAAAALRLAAELSPVQTETLAELAAALGTDVPSQLAPGVVLGTAAGDVVRPVDDLAPHAFLLLPQQSSLSTADVYRQADRLGLQRSHGDLASRRRVLEGTLVPGARLPPELLVNDLQPAAISLCPAIEQGLDVARSEGADTALVCGSGPTVAGLFWGEEAGSLAEARAAALSSRYPGAVAAVPVGSSFAAPRIA